MDPGSLRWEREGRHILPGKALPRENVPFIIFACHPDLYTIVIKLEAGGAEISNSEL